MGVMLRTLQQLGGGAGAGGGGSACLKALSLRLVCALWRQQDRCFPYLLQMIAERDFSACEEVLARLPARLTVLPFIQDTDELIEATRDADALVVASTRVTREVMTALERLKVVVRTGRRGPWRRTRIRSSSSSSTNDS